MTSYRFRILPKDLQAHYTAEHERRAKARRADAHRTRKINAQLREEERVWRERRSW